MIWPRFAAMAPEQQYTEHKHRSTEYMDVYRWHMYVYKHIWLYVYIIIILYIFVYAHNCAYMRIPTSSYIYIIIMIPTPTGGGRGGTKPTCRIPLFFAWKPWDSDPTPRSLGHWLENTSELSASMITAAQFFGGMPSLHMCCFSLTCA